MIGALILINTKPGGMREVYKKIESLDEVQEAKMLTGPYDIMAIVRADEVADITSTLIEKIRNIKWVVRTTTNLFIE